MLIVRCVNCDGFGWIDADDDPLEDGGEVECRWCGGIGYVYRGDDGIDRRIPESDYDARAAELEALEIERLRELGYTGTAKKPWEQTIRQGTRGGANPHDRAEE